MDNRELELVVGDSPPQDEALGALRGLTRTCVRWRKARVKGSRKLVHRCAKYETGPKGRNKLPARHGGVKRMPYGTRKSGRYPKAYRGMALKSRGKTLGLKARAQRGRRKGVKKFGWKTTAAGRRCWNRHTNKAAPKAKCTKRSTRKGGVRRTARRAYEPAAGRFRWKGRGKKRRCYDTKKNQFAKKASCNGRRKAAAGKRRSARKAAPGKRRFVMRKGRCRDTVKNVFAAKSKCNGRRKAARGGKRRSTRRAAPKRRTTRGRYVMRTPKKGGKRYCWDSRDNKFAAKAKCKKAGAARKRSTAGPKRRTKRRSSRTGSMAGAAVNQVAVLGDAGVQYEIIDTKRGRRCREVGGRFAKMEMCNMANQDLSGLDAATEEFLADANPVAKTVPTKCKKFETIYSEALGRDVKVCSDLAGAGADHSELNGLDIGAEDGALAGPLAKWYGFGVLGEELPIGPLAGAAAAGALAAVGVKVAGRIPGIDRIPHGGLLLTGLVGAGLTAMPRTRAFGIGALTGVATVAMFNIVGRLVGNTAAQAYEGDLGDYGYDMYGLGADGGVEVLSDYGDEVQVLTNGFGDVGNMGAIVEEVDGYGFGEVVPEMDGFGEVVAEEDMYGLGGNEGVEVLSSAFGSLPFAGAI